jgi:hypothetical protein
MTGKTKPGVLGLSFLLVFVSYLSWGAPGGRAGALVPASQSVDPRAVLFCGCWYCWRGLAFI